MKVAIQLVIAQLALVTADAVHDSEPLLQLNQLCKSDDACESSCCMVTNLNYNIFASEPEEGHS